jgi:hypothetical protein
MNWRNLQFNSQDANAEFTKILSFGLRSDYAALVEKRDLAALRYTRQGRRFAEVLLKQKPDDYDAYLAVGVENYLSGIKPAPIRWLLSADNRPGVAKSQNDNRDGGCPTSLLE